MITNLKEYIDKKRKTTNQFYGMTMDEVAKAIKKEKESIDYNQLNPEAKEMFDMPDGILEEIIANSNGYSLHPDITETQKNRYIELTEKMLTSV